MFAFALVAAACGSDDDSSSGSSSDSSSATEEHHDSLGDGSLGVVTVEAGEDIQIRSLNAITGDVAFLGIPNQRGVEQALADFGDIHGFSVTIGTGLDIFAQPMVDKQQRKPSSLTSRSLALSAPLAQVRQPQLHL